MYELRTVDWGTNDWTHFLAPIAEAIFFYSLSKGGFDITYLSTYISNYFTEETCAVETLSRESSSVSDSVAMNAASVGDEFRILLLVTSEQQQQQQQKEKDKNKTTRNERE